MFDKTVQTFLISFLPPKVLQTVNNHSLSQDDFINALSVMSIGSSFGLFCLSCIISSTHRACVHMGTQVIMFFLFVFLHYYYDMKMTTFLVT